MRLFHKKNKIESPTKTSRWTTGARGDARGATSDSGQTAERSGLDLTAQRPANRKSSGLIFLLAIVATILCYQAFNQRYDRELHRAVTAELSQTFPGADVFIGHVNRDSSGAIIASDMRLSIRTNNQRHTVFTVPRLVVQGRLDIAAWAHDAITVQQVDLHRPQLDVWPTADGSWSFESVFPRSDHRRTPPKLVLHDATVRLRKAADSKSPSVAIHRISGSIAPDTTSNDLEYLTRKRPIIADLSGGSAGTLDEINANVRFDPESNQLSTRGTIEGLRLSRSLVAGLPPQLSIYADQFSGLECTLSADFECSSAPNQPPNFQLNGKLRSGRLQDSRLPYPLENLSGDFWCENSKIQVRDLRAESSGADLKLNADILGTNFQSPMTIIADAQRLELDKRLYQSLPPELQQQWDKLELSGTVSGKVKLTFDGHTWTPTVFALCEGVNLRPWLFPYPLNDVRGRVTFQGTSISSPGMTGTVAGQPMSGSFSLAQDNEEWLGRLDCQVNGQVPVDEQLIRALTPSDQDTASTAADFVRTLNAEGSVKLVNATFQRTSVDDRWHRDIDAHVNNGSIRFDGFRYPIAAIRGRIYGQDDLWQLDQFEGRNDSGRILCSGRWMCVKSGSVPIDLNFTAYAVPIEEELKLALPEDAQFIWDELRPSGSIDQVDVRILRPTNASPIETVVNVTEDSTSNAASGRTLAVHPKTFPYLLTDVDCAINYTPGMVTIERVSGINGTSRLAIKGECHPTDDGRWKANVQWLPQTRLIMESELLRALPKSIRESLVKVDFRGPISVLGTSEIVFANRAETELSSAWDCQIAIEDGQLADGKTIGSLRGTIRSTGYSSGSQIDAVGSIEMDALTVRGVPVTRLRGPFALRGSNLYFGKRVSDAGVNLPPEQTPNLTAHALSGELELAGQARLDKGKFYVDASLRNAALSLLMKDLGVDSAGTEAICDADVSFNGIPWNTQTYEGQGSVRLSEANLYQLPFMIRLMRVASVNASDDSAFQTADINFEIDGDRIPLTKVACDGDVLRLRGDGEIKLRGEVKLDLYSYVGRRIPIANIVSPLLAESRYATFMLIEVRGSVDNPTMQRRAFPQLESTFQQIFPEVANNQAGNAVLPWRR